MGKKNIMDEHLLWDFVLWVQSGASGEGGPPGGKKTLEYVADGINRFLADKKPWLSSRGRVMEILIRCGFAFIWFLVIVYPDTRKKKGALEKEALEDSRKWRSC